MWFEALRCIGSVPTRWSAMIKNKQRRIRHRKRPPRSVQPSSGKCGKKHTKNIHPCFRFRHKHGKAGVVRAVPCLAATRPDPPLLSRTRPASSPAGRLFDGINHEWNHETTAKKKKATQPPAQASLNGPLGGEPVEWHEAMAIRVASKQKKCCQGGVVAFTVGIYEVLGREPSASVPLPYLLLVRQFIGNKIVQACQQDCQAMASITSWFCKLQCTVDSWLAGPDRSHSQSRYNKQEISAIITKTSALLSPNLSIPSLFLILAEPETRPIVAVCCCPLWNAAPVLGIGSIEAA